MDTTQRIKAAAATLMVGFLLATALTATALAADTPTKLTPQRWQAVRARAEATNQYFHLGAYSSARGAAQLAEERRSQAMNRYFHLGVYASSSPAAQQAELRRNEAINRYYRTGSYAVITTSNGFDWADAGIGAGAMLGLIVLAGGLTVVARRRTVREPSSPRTT